MRVRPDNPVARNLMWFFLVGIVGAVGMIIFQIVDSGITLGLSVAVFLMLLFAFQGWANRQVSRSDIVINASDIVMEGPRGWRATVGNLAAVEMDGTDLVLTPDPDNFDARLANARSFTRIFGPGRGRKGVVVVRFHEADVPKVTRSIARLRSAVAARRQG
ncbi:hypothetical protein [Parenemella sanctibonifatiensis]|nr:hypothetical protein [Parenemella sanctibonifatiensis]